MDPATIGHVAQELAAAMRCAIPNRNTATKASLVSEPLTARLDGFLDEFGATNYLVALLNTSSAAADSEFVDIYPGLLTDTTNDEVALALVPRGTSANDALQRAYCFFSLSASSGLRQRRLAPAGTVNQDELADWQLVTKIEHYAEAELRRVMELAIAKLRRELPPRSAGHIAYLQRALREHRYNQWWSFLLELCGNTADINIHYFFFKLELPIAGPLPYLLDLKPLSLADPAWGLQSVVESVVRTIMPIAQKHGTVDLTNACLAACSAAYNSQHYGDTMGMLAMAAKAAHSSLGIVMLGGLGSGRDETQ